MVSTNLAISLHNTLKEVARVEADHLHVMRENQASAASLRSLARQVKTEKENIMATPDFEERLVKAQDDMVAARRRWRTMKAVVSAVVAASGVDWAQDDYLRELVLDDEEEEELDDVWGGVL